MPGRLRQAAVRSPEAIQPSRAYNISGLDFHEPLAWRAGKAIAVADLLSRLQKLGTELRGLEQGQIPASEFTKLAQDLAHSNLLGHKDKGIRAWTLCSIVDILNICAPDAPFGPGQLKDIFTVVVNTILPALADPANAYNPQHIYILNSLVDTKSIVLITDLQNSESLIIPLFTICFDIVSGTGQTAGGLELAKSVEFQLRSMLVTIIDEVNLPQEATDIVLSQFLRVDPRTVQPPTTKSKKSEKDRKQDTLHLKDYPPAYNMAKSICTTCPEKMTVHVTQYFGNIIVTASASLEGDRSGRHSGRKVSEIDDTDDDDESLTDLRKAHRLLRELWRACPDVLQNVVQHIETELGADSAALRQLATETLGDIIAGIGISGPPPSSSLDPAAYPLPSIEEPAPAPLTTNPLLIAASPKPFGSIYATAFNAFLGRRIDKSPLVRTAWATAISRILLTDAGGIGISPDDRTVMLAGYAQMLRDIDEKVRYAAIDTLSLFDYHGVVNVLGADSGLATSRSVLSALAERVSDRKGNVREVAMTTLGRIWGVASRDIESGVERIVDMLGSIPTKILNAMYVNDMLTHIQLDRVLYDYLLPLSFPPLKPGKTDGQSKRGRGNQSQDTSAIDADTIRVRRMLVMVRGLDARAKQVFYGMQRRQADMAKAMKVYLSACEEYNGGVVDDDDDEQRLKDALTRYSVQLSKQFPDPPRASSDLLKFAKMHDRRNYQLIRFAFGPEYDYKTVTKAIKELTKRIKEGTTSYQSLMETLQPILYRCALVAYNRSHIPAIMEITRSDEGGLADTAHEMLKDVSARNPEVLKSHIQALCEELQDSAPSASTPESSSAADTLKACAGFARKYPAEVPRDRRFVAAMTNYAIYSHSPRAAKHAVTIILTVSDKRELHAKEIMSKAVKDCEHSLLQYNARLATIAQVCLLVPSAASVEEKNILRIAITECLQKNRSPNTMEDLHAWEVIPSEETVSKELALKIMVNRCRSADGKDGTEGVDLLAQSVLQMLMRLIQEQGEMTPTNDTPPAQRNHLRLTAAKYILKLCRHQRRCEELVSPKWFIDIALIVINPPNAVRTEFVHQLQKHLSRNTLHHRWYTILFLLAFEPDAKLKNDTTAWLKSRVQFFSRQQMQGSAGKAGTQTVMESIFARLMSLLAHHPDYPDKETAEFDAELLDFARYVVFYLQAVATEDNLSLIFHIAQRVKQTKDNVTATDAASEHIYVLSDLSQAVIRNYADLMPAHAKGVNLLQTWPGRVTMPNTLFAALPNHATAQDIASKNYLPEDVALGLERLVRQVVRSGRGGKPRQSAPDRKRRSSESVDIDDDEAEERKKSAKKAKKTSLPIRRTPKAKRKNQDASMSTGQPSRKSARVSIATAVNYAESDEDGDEDEDMRDVVASSPIKKKVARSIPATRNKLSTPDLVEDGQTGSEDGVDDGADDENVETSHANGDDQDDDDVADEDEDEDEEMQDQSDNAGDDEDQDSRSEQVPSSPPVNTSRNSRSAVSRTRGKAAQATPNPKTQAAAVTSKSRGKAVDSTVATPASGTRRSTRRGKA